MGLIGLLIAVILFILYLVFSNTPLSPFNDSKFTPKGIQDSAQSAMDKTFENYKINNSHWEENKVNSTDLP
jgi:hypothetical protein